MTIQTDPLFPSFSPDGDYENLRREEVMHRQNEVAQLLSQYSPTNIEAADGRIYRVLAAPGGAASRGAAPWDLVDAEDGGFTIAPGRIFSSFAAAADANTLEISENQPSTPAAGDAIWLELTEVHTETPTLKIRVGEIPEELYKFEPQSQTSVYVLKAAKFVLWEFREGVLPSGVRGRQFKEFHGRRIPRSSDLVLTWTSLTWSDQNHRRTSIPILLPR